MLPVLSIVIPVYNGGSEVVSNVEVIRERASVGLEPHEVEVVVVSDGSIDGTAERLLEARADVGIRVVRYDRNLGKGYAVKVGASTATGRWIAIVDADLDLDPADIPRYLDVARHENLDFAIGSKRHPESVVHYPASRRVASLAYQQLNRILFRLDVRDTQVGLKVFSREVADEVLPLLLVKQFAFDLELLAVARALGYGNVRELPVRLDYRFTGSQVRSRAVVLALLDTAAVFYRLRLLRTYERKRTFLGDADAVTDSAPLVTVVGTAEQIELLDYPRIEHVTPTALIDLTQAPADGVLAILGPRARPASNWLATCIPYLSRPDVGAVVTPVVAPSHGPVRARAAAAVLESRMGGGSRRSRYLPGNVGVTRDYPTNTIVVRQADYIAAVDENVRDRELVGWLAERDRITVYAPDSMITEEPPPLFAPHVRATFDHAADRGAAARRTRARSMSRATMLALAPAALAALGGGMAIAGSGDVRRTGLALVTAYGVVVAGSAGLAALRFRSARVGALAAPGLVITQAVYATGFLRGLARGMQ